MLLVVFVFPTLTKCLMWKRTNELHQFRASLRPKHWINYWQESTVALKNNHPRGIEYYFPFLFFQFWRFVMNGLWKCIQFLKFLPSYLILSEVIHPWHHISVKQRRVSHQADCFSLHHWASLEGGGSCNQWSHVRNQHIHGHKLSESWISWGEHYLQ